MIAVNHALEVLRNGWRDAATMFAPDSPEIAELLEARVEMAALAGELDEGHLLAVINDVESLATSTGLATSHSLALRLRRTVYEYLLALDAAPAPDAAAAVSAATEVGAVGHRTPSAATPAGPAADEMPWRTDADSEADADASARAQLDDELGGEPTWQYDDLPAQPWDDVTEAGVADEDGDQLPLWTQPVEEPDTATDAAATPAGGAPSPLAGRDGFHIVEETHPTSVPGAAPIAPLSMPDFEGDRADTDADPATSEPEPAAEAPTASAANEAPAPEPPEAQHPVAATPAPAARSGFDAEMGWRVRELDGAAAEAANEPLHDARFADIRHRIGDRLRRKRCDEAAALLQELAQEPGGRAVAELAMNAGDRCQTLGKSNAALNCFLAASRADPVYELPLSRLADICIDDHDADLAVSYLERIARLCKFRGDEKELLRVYRRIATIAPYREDILQALLDAQHGGRREA